jgi:hypothetical protein
MTIGQKLAETANKALETIAEDEFSRGKILEACRIAAAKGFMICEIAPSVPVDVSQTVAMKEITADLKKEWLELSWHLRALPGEVPYKILQIRWPSKKA